MGRGRGGGREEGRRGGGDACAHRLWQRGGVDALVDRHAHSRAASAHRGELGVGAKIPVHGCQRQGQRQGQGGGGGKGKGGKGKGKGGQGEGGKGRKGGKGSNGQAVGDVVHISR